MLSLCCCSGSSLVGGEQGGHSLDAEHRFSIAVASLVAGFPGGLAGKESACSSGDLDLIPGLGRSPGKGKCSPLTPVFWPGEFHGLGSQRVGHNWMTFTFTFIQVHARL